MPKMLEADGDESSYWNANTSLREKIPGPHLPWITEVQQIATGLEFQEEGIKERSSLRDV